MNLSKLKCFLNGMKMSVSFLNFFKAGQCWDWKFLKTIFFGWGVLKVIKAFLKDKSLPKEGIYWTGLSMICFRLFLFTSVLDPLLHSRWILKVMSVKGYTFLKMLVFLYSQYDYRMKSFLLGSFLLTADFPDMSLNFQILRFQSLGWARWLLYVQAYSSKVIKLIARQIKVIWHWKSATKISHNDSSFTASNFPSKKGVYIMLVPSCLCICFYLYFMSAYRTIENDEDVYTKHFTLLSASCALPPLHSPKTKMNNTHTCTCDKLWIWFDGYIIIAHHFKKKEVDGEVCIKILNWWWNFLVSRVKKRKKTLNLWTLQTMRVACD